jgi:predicted metal-binding membrane protein
VPIWTLMMAAMMLPSVSPVASLYARTIQGGRAIRIPGLVVGYNQRINRQTILSST